MVDELLGRAQRVTLGEDQHVREQMGARRERGEPTERRRGVVPDGAHGVGEATWDGGVVAHAQIEEARLVGHAGDAGQLDRS